MIKLKRLITHNFLSYEDEDIILDRNALVLISGRNNSNDSYVSNGTGKSALLAGISYAIYGKTITGISGDSVVNKEHGTDSHVFLYFSIGKSNYRIERYRKGHEGNGNKLRLYLDDTEVTSSTNAKTEEKIQTIIDIPFATYANTIEYGQGDVPIFAQATDSEKKKIIESIANTMVYSVARDKAADKKKELSYKLQSVDSSIGSLGTQLNLLNQYKSQNLSALQEFNQRKKEYEEEIKKNDENLAKENDKLAGYTKEYNLVQSSFDEDEYAKVSKKITDSQEVYNTWKDRYNTVVRNGKQDKDSYTQMFKQYKDIDTQSVCPTCGQPVTNEHRQKEKVNLGGKLKELVPVIKDEAAKATEYKNKAIEAYNIYKDNVNKSDAVLKKQQQVRKSLLDINRKISTCKDEINKLSYSSKSYKKLLANHPVIQDYDKDIKSTEDKVAKEKVNKKVISEEKYKYEILADKVFSRRGVPSLALDLVIPFLNEHTNSYLSKLSGSVLSVDMSSQTLNSDNTVSDRFSLKVYNASGADDYQNCSAGEKKRIDIAISFAIQDLLNSNSKTKMNIAIYDECFDGLDEVGTENVVDIMREKQKDIGTVFVITHNDHLKDLFENVINITKGTDGISKVEKD